MYHKRLIARSDARAAFRAARKRKAQSQDRKWLASFPFTPRERVLQVELELASEFFQRGLELAKAFREMPHEERARGYDDPDREYYRIRDARDRAMEGDAIQRELYAMGEICSDGQIYQPQ